MGKIRPQILVAIIILGAVALTGLIAAVKTGEGEVFVGISGMAITGTVALAKDLISGDAG